MRLQSVVLSLVCISTQLVSSETLGRTPDDAPVFLYAQSASGGSLAAANGDNLKLKMTDLGNVVLTVLVPEKGPNGPIENFPKSISISSKYFYVSWDQVFGTLPQQALLTFNTPGSKNPKSIGLIVKKPRRMGDSIIFDATKDVAGQLTLGVLPEGLQEQAVKIPSNFDSATLYIDNVQFFWDLVLRYDVPTTVSYDLATTCPSSISTRNSCPRNR